MEWDDYYQMMRRKNRRFRVSDGINNFKQEGRAFLDEWERSESKIGTPGATSWPNYEDFTK